MCKLESPQKRVGCDLPQQCGVLWLRGAGGGGGGLHGCDWNPRLLGGLRDDELQLVAVWLANVVKHDGACVALEVCMVVVTLGRVWASAGQVHGRTTGGRA